MANSDLHSQIVQQKIKELGKQWICIKECSYNGWIFDIFAINPLTKEIRIIEVDLTNKTDKNKVEYAKRLGEVEIVTISEKEAFKSENWILKCLSNRWRRAILELLFTNKDTNAAPLIIMEAIGFKSGNSGQFFYHLNFLVKCDLIMKKDNGFYEISEYGIHAVNLIKNL